MLPETEKSEIKQVYGISVEQKQRIKDFLQGAVYYWCNNEQNKQKWFAAKNFLGGDNKDDWKSTPMATLIENKDYDQAGKDAGWLLAEDKRSFETGNEGFFREYRWIGKEKITDNFNHTKF